MDVRGTSYLDVRGTPHRSEAVYSPPTHPEPDTPVSPHFPTQLTTGPVAPSAVFTVSRRGPRLALGHRSATPGRVQTSRFNTARVSPRMRRRIVHTLSHHTIRVFPCRKLHVANFHFSQSVSQLFHGPAPRSPLHRGSQSGSATPGLTQVPFTFRPRKHTIPHSGQSQLCNPIPCFEPASATGRRGEHFHAIRSLALSQPPQPGAE